MSSQSTTSASASSRSTRSVTSSRLPIGVAQTASGIRPRPSRAPRRRPARRRSARPRCRARRARPGTSRGPSTSTSRSCDLLRRLEQEVARGREAAADDDQLGVEDVDEARDPRAELLADPGQRSRCARGSPSRASADEAVRVGRRPERLARRARPRPCPTRTTRGARARQHRQGRPSWTITMCPSSAPAPIEPRYGWPPRISPPPTPVPSVSMIMSVVPRPAPDLPLGDRCGVRVVVDPDREPEPLAHHRRGTARPRAGCSPSRARCRARWSICDGIPKPTAATLSSRSSRTAASRPSSSASSDSIGVGYSRWRDHRPVAVDQTGEDLRPADVDTDHAGDPRAAATITRRNEPQAAQPCGSAGARAGLRAGEVLPRSSYPLRSARTDEDADPAAGQPDGRVDPGRPGVLRCLPHLRNDEHLDAGRCCGRRGGRRDRASGQASCSAAIARSR